MLIAVSIGFAVGLYLVLFFAVLHLVDSLSAARTGLPAARAGSDPEGEA
jgi:hypothetical protein